MTNDLPRRLVEHRSRKSKGGQIVGEFDVVHTEHHPDFATARLRENFLKSGQGREWLQENLQRSRPAAGG
jgi:predicted GIY-YIG superfamily endonuclease